MWEHRVAYFVPPCRSNLTSCADTYVPPDGVIGYDFFTNFTLVVDRLGGKVTFVKN